MEEALSVESFKILGVVVGTILYCKDIPRPRQYLCCLEVWKDLAQVFSQKVVEAGMHDVGNYLLLPEYV